METLEDLQTQLLLVNTAIARLIAGETITKFEVGSGSSARTYEYGEVSLENLNEEKQRISLDIQAAEGSSVAYRATSRMQTVWRKI